MKIKAFRLSLYMAEYIRENLFSRLFVSVEDLKTYVCQYQLEA